MIKSNSQVLAAVFLSVSHKLPWGRASCPYFASSSSIRTQKEKCMQGYHKLIQGKVSSGNAMCKSFLACLSLPERPPPQSGHRSYPEKRPQHPSWFRACICSFYYLADSSNIRIHTIVASNKRKVGEFLNFKFSTKRDACFTYRLEGAKATMYTHGT